MMCHIIFCCLNEISYTNTHVELSIVFVDFKCLMKHLSTVATYTRRLEQTRLTNLVSSLGRVAIDNEGDNRSTVKLCLASIDLEGVIEG